MTEHRSGDLIIRARFVAAALMVLGLVGVTILGKVAPGPRPPSNRSAPIPSRMHRRCRLGSIMRPNLRLIPWQRVRLLCRSFQVGRFAAYGGSATGWATSTDGGQTWQHGLLPGVSAASPNPNSEFVSVANQSVLYDAADSAWLIPTVGVVNCSLQVPTSNSCVGHVATEHTLLVNRSSDGLNWSLPVTAVTSNVDKPWEVCATLRSVRTTARVTSPMRRSMTVIDSQ